MIYYKNVVNGKVVGITTAPSRMNIRNFVEIGYSEFVELEKTFGNCEPIRPKPAVNMTVEKIQALSDRQDFIEDCIAEMALNVYE